MDPPEPAQHVAALSLAQEAPKTVPPRIRPAKPQVADPGDWSCPHCGDFQFARNVACRSCGGPRPPAPSRSRPTATRVAAVARSMEANEGADFKEGDWMCRSLGGLQRQRESYRIGGETHGSRCPRQRLWRSSAWQPDVRVDLGLRFARNSQCRRCGVPREQKAGRVSSWTWL